MKYSTCDNKEWCYMAWRQSQHESSVTSAKQCQLNLQMWHLFISTSTEKETKWNGSDDYLWHIPFMKITSLTHVVATDHVLFLFVFLSVNHISVYSLGLLPINMMELWASAAYSRAEVVAHQLCVSSAVSASENNLLAVNSLLVLIVFQ